MGYSSCACQRIFSTEFPTAVSAAEQKQSEQERSKILLFRGLNSLAWDKKLKLTVEKHFLPWKVSESTFEPSNWGPCLQKKGGCLQARQSSKAVKTETQRPKEWKTESFKAVRNNHQKIICLYSSLSQHFTRVPFQFTPYQKCSFSMHKRKETFSWFLNYRNHTFLTKCGSAWPINKMVEKNRANSVSIAHSEPVENCKTKSQVTNIWPCFLVKGIIFDHWRFIEENQIILVLNELFILYLSSEALQIYLQRVLRIQSPLNKPSPPEFSQTHFA